MNNSVEQTWDPVESVNPGSVFQRPYPATIDSITTEWMQMMVEQTGNVL